MVGADYFMVHLCFYACLFAVCFEHCMRSQKPMIVIVAKGKDSISSNQSCVYIAGKEMSHFSFSFVQRTINSKWDISWKNGSFLYMQFSHKIDLKTWIFLLQQVL